MDLANAFVLKEIEERQVAVGSVRPADPSRYAALEAAGYVRELVVGVFVLTAHGWAVAHAFRRHVASSMEAYGGSGVWPPFTEPAAPADVDEREDLAREAFVRAIARDPDVFDKAALAGKVFDAAQAFQAAARSRR